MNCRRSGRWAQRLVESVASRPSRAGLGGNRESGVSGGCGGFVNAGATAGPPAKFPPEPFPAFRVSAVLLRTHRDQAADSLREDLLKARYYFDRTRSKGEGARNGLGEGLSYKSPRLLARLGHEIANFLPDYAKQFEPDDSLPNPAVLEMSIRAKAEAPSTKRSPGSIPKPRTKP